jgi:16S rRNA (adenine1518-N6/adenine1519-N6)-dimethyltransferase
MTSSPYHRPRKRFGQNFLHDEYVIQQIVAAIAPQPGQTLVEIGPGQGAITRLLVDNCRELHLVEIDRDLVARLASTFAQYKNLHIHNVDALRFDFCALSSGQPLRLVGNLPYNISTPLLFHVIDDIECIEDMHFMLQREVVERMAARPGNKDYGRLSIMIQYYCQVEPILDVGPESFTPAPKVDSSIVRLTPHRIKPVHVDDFSCFSKLVAQAFTMRRKTLRNALKNLLNAEQIAACGVDPQQRPDVIDIDAYARLGNYYSKMGNRD